MQVLLVAFPQLCALDIVGPSEVFSLASQISGRPIYSCGVVTADRVSVVESESGIRLAVDDTLAATAAGAHTMLVGGGNGFRDALTNRPLISAIADAANHVERVASVCTGAFLLGEAGLLDGRRATTHWMLADELAARFPATTVVPDELYVSSGPVVTSAGITSGIDLALAMVASDHGDDLARQVARRMVVYLHRSGGQSQFSERHDQRDVSDPGVAAALAAVVGDPAADHSVTALAALANMSVRHFTRVFRSETGTTPGRWVERVRVDAARVMLEQSNTPPESIAERCGFRSYHTMRQAFQRVLGVSPSRYRSTH